MKMQPVPENSFTSKLCRCCLRERDRPFNIHENLCKELFRDTLNLLLSSDSRLPQWVCSDCIDFLKEVKSFRDMVVATEKHLLEDLNPKPLLPPELNNSLQVSKLKHEDVDDNYKSDYDDGGTNYSSENGDDDFTFQPSNDKHNDDESAEKDMKHEDIVLTIGSTVVKRRVAKRTRTESEEINTPVLPKPSTNVDSEKQIFYDKDSDEQIFNGKRKKHNTPSLPDENVDSESDPLSLHFETHNSDTSVNSYGKNELVPIIPKKVIIKSDVIVTPASKLNLPRILSRTSKFFENIVLILKLSTITPFRYQPRSNNQYKCFYCNTTYSKMKELKKHTESHNGQVNEKEVKSKISSVTKSVKADVSSMKCRLCDKRLNTIDTLTEHLKGTHNKKIHEDTGRKFHGIIGFDFSVDELKCHLCGKHCRSMKELVSHMVDHYSDYICHICGKKYAALNSYKYHMKSHGPKQLYYCNYCLTGCTKKSALITHMAAKHCFKFKDALKCFKCPKTFEYREWSERTRHMKEMHADNTINEWEKEKKIITCVHCQNGRKYKTASTLWRHVKSAHGNEKYECDYCGKVFSARNVLQFHIRIHTDDKRHKCTLCGAAFIQKHRLKSHYKNNHSKANIQM